MRELKYKNQTIISSLSDEVAIATLKSKAKATGYVGGVAGNLCSQWNEWGHLKGSQVFWAHKLALEHLASIVADLQAYQIEHASEVSLLLRDLILRHSPTQARPIVNVSGVSDDLAKALLPWGKILLVNRVLNHVQALAENAEKPGRDG